MKTLDGLTLSKNENEAIREATRMLKEEFPVKEVILFGIFTAFPKYQEIIREGVAALGQQNILKTVLRRKSLSGTGLKRPANLSNPQEMGIGTAVFRDKDKMSKK